MNRFLTRRNILRGTLKGAAVTVALPLLDCFLDGNGTALASGAPLPVQFGTWFWGLGHNPGRAIALDGANFEFIEECKALVPFKKQINFFNGFNVPTDGRPNLVHHTGWVACRTGTSPGGGAGGESIPAPTLDVLISDAIGSSTRFRSLEVAATGDAKDSYSARGSGAINAAEPSPLALYARIFGPEFADPNKADFKPDPRVMLRQSVLSAVKDQGAEFAAGLGNADKARMDEYFTSVRQLEQQLDLQLQKPPPAEACQVPTAPADAPVGTEVDTAIANHKTMAHLLGLALACNQTYVFNMAYSASISALRKGGESSTHHTLTHEEPIDPKLQFQPETSWFVTRSMEALATFIDSFAGIREGDGTLLDNTLIFAHTDTSYAKVHAIDDIPMMSIGRAGGRIKTGLHVAGKGDPITRVGLTMQQVMGLAVDKWGTQSLQTGKPVTEILTT